MPDNDEKRSDTKEPQEQVSDAQAAPSPPPAVAAEITGSRFTKGEKWFIVCFSSFVGLFSPLTANVYFPAIPTLSRVFNKSTELINLTVTMYMVLQGVAPMLWGPLSDHVGRRPISAACLLLLSLSCVGLALVPTSDYWLLMFLRCFQAAGSASTIAIGAGVIGDISTRAERGGFFGVFTLGPMVGPAIGPVIGGVLADRLGWRSIFWFLCIAASICFIVIILFQPETLPAIADSKRNDLFVVYRPVLPIIGRNKPSVKAPSTPRPKVPRNPFRLFLNPDVDVLLAISALTCAVFYGILATVSSLFARAYPSLNEIEIGLCFLAFGGGTILGSTITGRMLDRDYRRFKKNAEAQHPGAESGIDLTKEESFPLEKARLRLMPYFILLLVATCAGYGWCIEKQVNLAGPLILQAIVGYIGISVMNASQTLLIDLMPGQSSSVSACSNITRSTLSALIVSVIELVVKAIGIGWTFVLLSGLALLSLPLVYISIRIGPRCRSKRNRAKEEELARIVDDPK
ncbi:hypothetical protein GALMADRAFT_250288 [Galerina marginata CBS 339.88]|uniref:Major facilitator superfamily (MFS) profile domain-containing protein n=1 Tax=Galerina marginata (strain CBS 339.88) TaxID=685588 RepID=A0A067T5U0_GALM3|nr:hypothetical protein GALMADRAFT_250288 [Galerina marginata CBS 339.88]